jgi:ABC-2 type transport system permease protein
VMLDNREEVERRRLAVQTSNIEDEKRRKIAESKSDMEIEVRKIQRGVRMVALLVPPLPALLLGAFVFAVRLGRENRGANPNRLV